jgi:hypothetical protein
MTETINDIQELRTEDAPGPEGPCISRWAKCAVGFGVVSALAGLLSIGSGRIDDGWIMPAMTDGMANTIATSVMAGIVAVVLAFIAAIRIRCSGGGCRGYGLCLLSVGLIFLGAVFCLYAVGSALK